MAPIKSRTNIIALIYDFDGTLSPGNMQEYRFMEAIGVDDKDAFWQEVDQMRDMHNANQILCSMRMMIEKARAAHVPITRLSFQNFGANIPLFPGVVEWFENINKIGEQLGLEVRHYINSSGMREMIEGTEIASYFSSIYASSFMYDENGVAVWPASCIDFTNKTKILSMINKGIEKLSQAEHVNQVMPENERPIPFQHMIYFGDGETDVPSMRMVREYGGHAICVYDPTNEKKVTLAKKLRLENRINSALPADYQVGSMLYEHVVSLLKILADYNTLLIASLFSL